MSEWFGVSLSWVEKVLRRWRTTGQTAARPHRHGPLPVLSPARLERLVQRHPAATLAELGRRLQVSASTVHRALARLDLLRKKTLHASERDTPRVERLRARWRQTRRRLDAQSN